MKAEVDMPSFLGDGSTPRRSDAKRIRWVKMLLNYQSIGGSLAANEPQIHDPIRVIKQKLLCSLLGEPYTG